ncbi:DUF3592 domain-containing protein [Streptomyces griseosporeus]|uniref:hypothetical protein n=1 Tax=Streptomyces griseosporeus TaxID=1910 RepID=UPI0036F9FB3E
MTSIDTLAVLRGRWRSVARLTAGGELLLDAPALRRRIPLTAVDRVGADGPAGRTLTVVLAAEPGRPPPAHSLTARNPAAVRAFADAVRQVLPARPSDGPGAVTEERPKRLTAPRRPLWWWLVAAAYLLVAAALLARGRDALAGWLLGPLVLAPGGVAVAGGAELARQGWGLRVRGRTTEGRLVRSYAVHGADEPSELHVYHYVDEQGLAREWRGPGSGARRVEIRYDPRESGVAVLGRSGTGRLLGGIAFALVVGGALLGIGVAIVSPALWAVVG